MEPFTSSAVMTTCRHYSLCRQSCFINSYAVALRAFFCVKSWKTFILYLFLQSNVKNELRNQSNHIQGFFCSDFHDDTFRKLKTRGLMLTRNEAHLFKLSTLLCDIAVKKTNFKEKITIDKQNNNKIWQHFFSISFLRQNGFHFSFCNKQETIHYRFRNFDHVSLEECMMLRYKGAPDYPSIAYQITFTIHVILKPNRHQRYK